MGRDRVEGRDAGNEREKDETNMDKQTRFIERVDQTESPRYQGGIRNAELATLARVNSSLYCLLNMQPVIDSGLIKSRRLTTLCVFSR